MHALSSTRSHEKLSQYFIHSLIDFQLFTSRSDCVGISSSFLIWTWANKENSIFVGNNQLTIRQHLLLLLLSDLSRRLETTRFFFIVTFIFMIEERSSKAYNRNYEYKNISKSFSSLDGNCVELRDRPLPHVEGFFIHNFWSCCTAFDWFLTFLRKNGKV